MTHVITAEAQDWNRAVSDHIRRRDDGWDMTRVITRFTDGVVVAYSVARPDRRGWLDTADRGANTMRMRYARVNVPDNTTGSAFAETVALYLPSRYHVAAVVGSDDTSVPRPVVVIAGEDNAGWTMGDYVLPRLASGMIFGREITGIYTQADGDNSPDMVLDRIVSDIVSELNGGPSS
jgi:hypothetical protein